MSILIEFKPWRKFLAQKDDSQIQRWLEAVGEASVHAFKNMGNYPPPSSPGEYPHIRTGDLYDSIDHDVSANEVTVGSNMRYSKFLREGTTIMQRRKMSDNALQEGIAAAGGRLNQWVKWVQF